MIDTLIINRCINKTIKKYTFKYNDNNSHLVIIILLLLFYYYKFKFTENKNKMFYMLYGESLLCCFIICLLCMLHDYVTYYFLYYVRNVHITF